MSEQQQEEVRFQCVVCGLNHKPEMFKPLDGTEEGHTKTCISCLSRSRKDYKKRSRSVPTPDQKKCNRCKHYMSKDAFRKGYGKDGLKSRCRTCEGELKAEKIAKQLQRENGPHDHGEFTLGTINDTNKRWVLTQKANFNGAAREWMRAKAKILPTYIGDMAYAYAVHMGWIKQDANPPKQVVAPDHE